MPEESRSLYLVDEVQREVRTFISNCKLYVSELSTQLSTKRMRFIGPSKSTAAAPGNLLSLESCARAVYAREPLDTRDAISLAALPPAWP
ncbi:hypothetical protein AAHC03_020790 [Spirometra sp. Aus1]